MKLALVALLTLGLMPYQSFQAATSLKGRIYRGFEGSASQFPYQVYISMTTELEEIYCSGALIRKKWVLSAAHCFEGIKHDIIKMYFGGNNLDSLHEFTMRTAIELHIHEKYNNLTLENDIALLKMLPVPYSKNISSVAIAKRPNIMLTLRKAIISGWGAKGNSGIQSTRLRYILLTIIPKSLCKEFFPGTNEVHKNEFCAQEYYESPCMGDSGAPLVTTPKRLLVGILSGIKEDDCQSGAPSIYTLVGAYRNWIKSITGI